MSGPSLSATHRGVNFEERGKLLDTVYEASKSIRTMAPFEKSLSEDVAKAIEAIREANCVYILGYGFDETNSKLLDVPESLEFNQKSKSVMMTNCEDSNVVNKRASRLMLRRPDAILAGKPSVMDITISPKFYLEKSVRNVYDALALDFDSLEEHLWPGTTI
ncbi:MAG: hypothetical protein WCE52_19535 [Candidatus Acidiferrum sp.]